MEIIDALRDVKMKSVLDSRSLFETLKTLNNLFILFLFFLFFSSENDEENGSEDSRTKRRRILGPEFGSIDLNSEEGKKLLAAKSRHVGAVLEVRNEEGLISF